MKNRDIFDKMTQALRNNSIQNMKDDSASNFVTDILSEILSNPEESKSASVTFMRNFKKSGTLPTELRQYFCQGKKIFLVVKLLSELALIIGGWVLVV